MEVVEGKGLIAGNVLEVEAVLTSAGTPEMLMIGLADLATTMRLDPHLAWPLLQRTISISRSSSLKSMMNMKKLVDMKSQTSTHHKHMMHHMAYMGLPWELLQLLLARMASMALTWAKQGCQSFPARRTFGTLLEGLFVRPLYKRACHMSPALVLTHATLHRQVL